MAKLGYVGPRQKPIRLRVGSRFDMSARVEASRKAREKGIDDLYVSMAVKYLRTFDTKLPCNCGKATIKDHASNHNTEIVRCGHSQRDFIIGPGPYRDPMTRVTDFKIFHAYWCDSCGASYKASVIEGVRKYVPLELRPSQLRWKEKKIQEIRAL